MRNRLKGQNLGVGAIVVAYSMFGVFLWAQPSRWARTPSYANLLQLLSQQTWGSIYLVAAGLLLGAFFGSNARWFKVVALTLSMALDASWLLAFVVRFFTDDATTIVNIVSWSMFLYVLIVSAVYMDADSIREAAMRDLAAKEQQHDS